ncbi:MAG: acetyl-CoA carboxylase biotin carboxyl carrier protein [Saprospiraceae bacterium]|nr:acetyl-CoA carboxylase biotin carboxyl carrier protein [Saprospiraceae bacterium]
MTFKEIQDLIKLANKSGLTEFKMKDGDFTLSIRTKNYSDAQTQIVQTGPAMMPVQQPVAQAPAPAPAAEAEAAQAPKEEPQENLLEVKSPIVGTFYRSSSPDKDPFVKVGDSINAGDTVCIVEAMKLFNEIESEVSGKIVKVMIDDASPVEYDQVLFLVDPKG